MFAKNLALFTTLHYLIQDLYFASRQKKREARATTRFRFLPEIIIARRRGLL
jgi:hypothetical protein